MIGQRITARAITLVFAQVVLRLIALWGRAVHLVRQSVGRCPKKKEGSVTKPFFPYFSPSDWPTYYHDASSAKLSGQA